MRSSIRWATTTSTKHVRRTAQSRSRPAAVRRRMILSMPLTPARLSPARPPGGPSVGLGGGPDGRIAGVEASGASGNVHRVWRALVAPGPGDRHPTLHWIEHGIAAGHAGSRGG